MYRRTDPQLSLMNAASGLSDGASERLRLSWAEGFRREVMPELLASEDGFSVLYAGGGRPNWSVARMLGVSLLQQVQNLSDQQALDALSFDRRWQHALDVTDDDAYLSRRSLVEFRRRLVLHDADGALLRAVFDRICAAGMARLGVSASEQRLDSTLVTSNIRGHGRLSLARETLRVFVRSLDAERRAKLPAELARWYTLESDAWDAHPSGEQAKDALAEVGVWVRDALELFADDAAVTTTEPYQLLQRLAQEHGAELGISLQSITDDDGDNEEDSDDEPPSAAAESGYQRAKRRARNKRKSRKKIARARYWSPHDPDASFGHKGLGYHVHITETCRNNATELLTDYAVLTAAQPDIGQTLPALKRLERSGVKPDVLYADAGYPTPADLVATSEQGVDLCAPMHRGKLSQQTISRSEFEIDARSGEVKSCPQGHAPTRHAQRESSDTIHPRRSLHALFDRDTCNACPELQRCPVRQPNNKYADYRLDIARELLARDARWTEQQTVEWLARYNIRGGVEATMSELKRAHGLGRLRVRGMQRVTIQVALKTTACNIKRWLRAVLCGPQHASEASTEASWWHLIANVIETTRQRPMALAA